MSLWTSLSATTDGWKRCGCVGEKDHSSMKSELAQRWRSQGIEEEMAAEKRSDQVSYLIPFLRKK
jgi:hypothetical protein